MQDTNIESLEGEIWKDIPGYEGLYQVSNIGRVKSLERYVNHRKGIKMLIRSRILSPSKDKFGYLVVALSFKSKTRSYRIHRLIGIVFLGLDMNEKFIPSKSFCVCHKDDDPTNNRLSNLFLGTLSENSNERNNKGRTISTYGIKNPRSRIILQYSLKFNFINEHYGSGDAGRATGIRSYDILRCCRGFIGSAGGYIWKYKFK